MSFEDKYVVSKRGQPAGSFTAREIIDLLRMKELSTIHKVKVDDQEMTVATFIDTYETGGLPEQNLGKPEAPVEEEEPEETEEFEEPPPPEPPADTPPPEPGPTDEIHISREGQRFGPYLLNEVKDYLKSGNLRFSDLVWYDGVTEWLPLSSVPGVGEGIKTLHAAAPPPPKPPPARAGPPQAPAAAEGPPQATRPEPVFGSEDDEDDDDAALEGERKGIAGLGARALALFIDVLLIAAASSAVVGLVFWLHTMTNPGKDIERWQLFTVPMVIAVIVGWLYSSLTESSAGMATLGKRMVKAQVCLEETNRRIGFGRATGRAFAKIIGVVGFFMIFTSRRRQGLHDMITGTIVRQSIVSMEDDFADDSDENDSEGDDA